MELLNENEIKSIIKQFDLEKVLKWDVSDFSDSLIGHLGEHLKLTIEAENKGVKSELKLFVKCMPRFDKLKSEYLQDLKFFHKEYITLSKLFGEFQNGEGSKKWRPKLLFIRENLFVFEDVSQLGYEMPSSKDTMTIAALKATVKTLARFHAESYIYEEKRSEELGRPYRIWDEYSEHLQEPIQSKLWRDTGRNAVIEYLKVFSKHKSIPGFSKKIEDILPALYETSLDLMKPSSKYRNAVVHRDLWSNNILIKQNNSELHAIIVDFQTVVYSCPMLDLSSLIFFNTTRADRDIFSSELIDMYHNDLAIILQEAGVNIETILPKHVLMEAYNESLTFALTQASLIVPIVAMSTVRSDEIFCDPVKSERVNVVSRSEEFIEIANEDPIYRNRVSELLDEIVERYIYLEEENIPIHISCVKVATAEHQSNNVLVL